MPRVRTKVKNRAGREYTCSKCARRVEPGQQYYTWSFRYGGARYQHSSCGYPKPSQLTQSKLATVYEAQESAREGIDNAEEASDIVSALEDVAQAARDIADEYRDAVQAMNMEGAGTENEERADALEAYADALDDAASDMGGEEWAPAKEQEDGTEKVDEDGNTEEEWLQELRDRATEAVDGLEL